MNFDLKKKQDSNLKQKYQKNNGKELNFKKKNKNPQIKKIYLRQNFSC